MSSRRKSYGVCDVNVSSLAILNLISSQSKWERRQPDGEGGGAPKLERGFKRLPGCQAAVFVIRRRQVLASHNADKILLGEGNHSGQNRKRPQTRARPRPIISQKKLNLCLPGSEFNDIP